MRQATEPDWLNPANDRKTPYTDAELDVLAADFIAMSLGVAGGVSSPRLASEKRLPSRSSASQLVIHSV